MKAVYLFSPRVRAGLYPIGFSLRHSERPVEQIAHVRQDLHRSARTFSQLKASKPGRRITLDFGRTISKGGKRMPEESALGIFQCQSGSSARVST